MSTARLLLVDRAQSSARSLAAALARAGYAVERAADAAGARSQLAGEPFDCWVGEAEVLAQVLEQAHRDVADAPPLVLLEDFQGAGDASLDALRQRASDSIQRPAPDGDVLRAVARALEHRRLASENDRLRRELGGAYDLGGMSSRDARMRAVLETAAAVADTRAAVLIQGESGTGKTLLAHALHQASGRRARPFVVVHCGALPAQLLESELFGHARGAFTGAVKERAGRFEAAEGGTLFLDEIATASLDLQVKLLRVIESGSFERVGEETTRQVDVRIVAATHADLAAEVAAGRFRSDLYWRLFVVAITLSPLRERPLDVTFLAQRFLERFARVHGRELQAFSSRARGRLLAHAWPGNVRELEHVIERAVLLAHASILEAADLFPGEARAQAPAGDSARTLGLDDLPLGPLAGALAIPERFLVERALRHADGSRQAAARLLGINRTTLFNKMRKYDLLAFPRGGGGRDAQEPA
jgi:two-component system response regulator HydG